MPSVASWLVGRVLAERLACASAERRLDERRAGSTAAAAAAPAAFDLARPQEQQPEVEAHGRASGNRRESGPSRENASAGRALSKRPTAAATCASTFAGAWRAACGEHALGGALHARAAAARRRTAASAPTPSRRPRAAARAAPPAQSRSSPRGSGAAVMKTGRPARVLRVEQVARGDGVRRVRLGRRPRRATPPPRRRSPAQKSAMPEVELHHRALRVQPGQLVRAGRRVPSGQVRTPGRRAPRASRAGERLRRARARLPSA